MFMVWAARLPTNMCHKMTKDWDSLLGIAINAFPTNQMYVLALSRFKLIAVMNLFCLWTLNYCATFVTFFHYPMNNVNEKCACRSGVDEVNV